MGINIAPSMMCASYANLYEDMKEIDAAGVDYLHCDIMDGHYVPNMTVGPDYIKTLRHLSNTKIDLHLMVEKPEHFIQMFDMQPNERVCFHFETTRHAQRLLGELKKQGLQAGIALAPSVPTAMIEDMLGDIDFIHIMLVNPGYAGQPIIPAMVEKVSKTRKMLNERGLDTDIEVDGCVSYDNISHLIECGASTFVLGVYSCFDKQLSIRAAIERIKSIIKSLDGERLGE